MFEHDDERASRSVRKNKHEPDRLLAVNFWKSVKLITECWTDRDTVKLCLAIAPISKTLVSSFETEAGASIFSSSSVAQELSLIELFFICWLQVNSMLAEHRKSWRIFAVLAVSVSCTWSWSCSLIWNSPHLSRSLLNDKVLAVFIHHLQEESFWIEANQSWWTSRRSKLSVAFGCLLT